MRKVSVKSAVPFVLSVVLYIAVVLAVAFVSVRRVRGIVEDSVDRRLASAASALKFLLADDFHDRARGPASIGRDEEIANRERFNAFASSAGFAWVYTVVELDGALYFSAPTVSPSEAAERDRWYFYPYEEPPAEFFEALRTGESRYATYEDEWGTFRSIALPELSPGGVRYLSCADLEINLLDAVVGRQLAASILASLALCLAGIPFILIYRREIVGRNRLLAQLNDRLADDAHRAELRFRSLFEHSADAVAVLDDRDRALYVNPAFLSLFGWSREELVGRELPFVPSELAEEARILSSRLRAEQSPFRELETRRLAKSGRTLSVAISGAPLSDARGRYSGALLLMRDRTERKRLEARIAEDEKYRATASLAAGAAHDFNNALMLIQGNASLLAMEEGLSPPAAELVRRIEGAVRSASELTRELLGFAHPDPSERKSIDVARTAARTARAFAETRPELRVDISGEEAPLYALADEAAIERTLLNLLVNAEHATGGAGRVSIAFSSESIDAEAAAALSLVPGRYATVRVEDDGAGMSGEVLQRLFEPFFTTKGKGRGTGLGLATSYAALRALGGAIYAESEPGKGARFTFHLPASDFTA
jgi:PAS domain S-box-containing protein